MRARPRAFISHSSKDLPFARRLGDILRAQGVDVWLDDLQLKAGDVLTGTIARAVRRHDLLILVISNRSGAVSGSGDDGTPATSGCRKIERIEFIRADQLTAALKRKSSAFCSRG